MARRTVARGFRPSARTRAAGKSSPPGTKSSPPGRGGVAGRPRVALGESTAVPPPAPDHAHRSRAFKSRSERGRRVIAPYTPSPRGRRRRTCRGRKTSRGGRIYRGRKTSRGRSSRGRTSRGAPSRPGRYLLHASHARPRGVVVVRRRGCTTPFARERAGKRRGRARVALRLRRGSTGIDARRKYPRGGIGATRRGEPRDGWIGGAREAPPRVRVADRGGCRVPRRRGRDARRGGASRARGRRERRGGGARAGGVRARASPRDGPRTTPRGRRVRIRRSRRGGRAAPRDDGGGEIGIGETFRGNASPGTFRRRLRVRGRHGRGGRRGARGDRVASSRRGCRSGAPRRRPATFGARRAAAPAPGRRRRRRRVDPRDDDVAPARRHRRGGHALVRGRRRNTRSRDRSRGWGRNSRGDLRRGGGVGEAVGDGGGDGGG